MIHDFMTAEKFCRFSFPALKGHVKIELKNVHNGKREVAFEGDNMITDAVKDIFASNLCGAMDYRTMLPLYSKMFGGILCFGDQLDVSSAGASKDYFIPDNNTTTVIAHAGQTTFSDQADDVTRGNPLNTSVVVADGAVTLAWEWGSAAGNGTIKSLGLTHTDVGDAGTGSVSNAFKAMTPNINSNLGFVANKPAWFIDKNGYGYDLAISGATVTLTRYPMAYTEVGLIGMPYDYLTGKASVKSITVGTTYSQYPCFAFDKEHDKLYLIYSSSTGTTANVDVIDISNWNSLTTSHTTWTIDVSVPELRHGKGFYELPFFNGNIYLPRNDTSGIRFVRVNIASSSDQSEINTVAGVGATGSTGVFMPNTTGRVIAGKNFVINNGVLYPTSIGEPDSVNSTNYQNQWFHSTLDQGVGLVGSVFKRNGANALYYPSASKFYLGTKYNLPEAVVKTNNQSMVITYTLTEVSE